MCFDLLALPASRLGDGLKVSSARKCMTCRCWVSNMVAPGKEASCVISRTISHYNVIGKLVAGGMGVVHNLARFTTATICQRFAN